MVDKDGHSHHDYEEAYTLQHVQIVIAIRHEHIVLVSELVMMRGRERVCIHAPGSTLNNQVVLNEGYGGSDFGWDSKRLGSCMNGIRPDLFKIFNISYAILRSCPKH